jgi:hypothetical protein
MSQNRVNLTKFSRPVNATAAGTTAINGTGTDMQDFEGVVFTASMGALTAGQVTSLKAQGSNDNGGSDPYADITGAATGNAADGDSNRVLVLEVIRPQKRWIRCVVNRATQNAVIDGVVAEQYGAKKQPAAQSADVSQSLAKVGA